MKIVETYSHLNGLEYLIVRRPDLWQEVQRVVESVNAAACRTKVSKEVRMQGELKYSPIEILPMKALQAEMSSGPGYYEGELYNVIRNGRGVPSVPLVMIGVAP